ncbi:efflux RND transporter periplasmic adaptor subunit [Arenimonas sp.]|uniref:efflux RND transporter periplasmic adaptor subunit n=1 Tax=Arenimonas sp. TaxID=1872635 RepID=UPI0035ADACD7
MSLYRILFPLLIGLAVSACGGGDDHAHDEDGDHDDHAAAEPAKGEHNGRLLTDGPYTVELAIFEDGVPPEYRAWLYKDGEPLPPEAVELRVVLARLGGTTDTHAFTPRGDHLVGSLEVYEPHSFDVTVTARIDGKNLSWTYPSYEGRTTIAAAVAEASGIVVAPAGPGVIRDEHEVQGLLTPIEGRYARVVARFPGPVKALRAGVGDTVRAGETLATVESNVSLSDYAVAAPLAGTVLARHAAVGDLAGEQPLFEVADLSELWVDLHLFGTDAQHITQGLPVDVTRLSDGVSVQTTLDRVLPGTATASQSTVARATVVNADGRWRPGAAVRARVTVAEQPVPLMVPLAALQRFRDWDVVFVRHGDDYEIRPLELGRRDGVNVEVLSGLEAGDPVVVAQSYLVKADIEKSGASHDH